jgi:hypothetical protein
LREFIFFFLVQGVNLCTWWNLNAFSSIIYHSPILICICIPIVREVTKYHYYHLGERWYVRNSLYDCWLLVMHPGRSTISLISVFLDWLFLYTDRIIFLLIILYWSGCLSCHSNSNELKWFLSNILCKKLECFDWESILCFF